MRISLRPAGGLFAGPVSAAALLVFGAVVAIPFSPARAVEPTLRIMAPSAPGTGWDQLGHAIEEAMPAGAGRRVEIRNVPGKGGTVGLGQFVSQPGDGEPLMITGLAMVSGVLVNRSPVALDRVAPVARLAAEYLVVVVPENSAIDSIRTFAASLAAGPEKLAWAGGPVGSVGHVGALLFARIVGADLARLVYIPYLGSAEALLAVEEGRVAAAIIPAAELQSDPKTGPIRILAVTGPDRLETIDAPSLREAGIDLDVYNWRGIVAPLATTPQYRLALSDAFAAMAKTPRWAEALKKRGWRDAFMPAEAFGEFLKSEQIRVKDAFKSAGLLKRMADPPPALPPAPY